jgi:hypothetical protein
MTGPIRIYIDPNKIAKSDFDQLLMSKYDAFYRRIVEYILKDLEEGTSDELMATLVDGEGVEYDMRLPREGYVKSLHKSIQYFTLIEEYETCGLIKDMIKQIEK